MGYVSGFQTKSLIGVLYIHTLLSCGIEVVYTHKHQNICTAIVTRSRTFSTCMLGTLGDSIVLSVSIKIYVYITMEMMMDVLFVWSSNRIS